MYFLMVYNRILNLNVTVNFA